MFLKTITKLCASLNGVKLLIKSCQNLKKNLCLEIVPYNKQNLIPMMWTFVIKSDGTKKARLVGRGDLMLYHIAF
jgi:hypothetical protein